MNIGNIDWEEVLAGSAICVIAMILIIGLGIAFYGVCQDKAPVGYYFSGKELKVSIPWGSDMTVHDCDGSKLKYIIENNLLLPKKVIK